MNRDEDVPVTRDFVIDFAKNAAGDSLLSPSNNGRDA
jgi:hypothetical protein